MTFNESLWNILGTISTIVATITALILATYGLVKERRNKPKFKIIFIEEDENYSLQIVNEGLGTALQLNLRLLSVIINGKEHLEAENIPEYFETLGDLQNGESEYITILSQGPGGIIFRLWTAGLMPNDQEILITLRLTGNNFQAHEFKIQYNPERGFKF